MDLEINYQVPASSTWQQARYGEYTITANLDNGVWPESKSFSDHGLGSIPTKWKGSCDIPCNRKLIGGKAFYKGWEAYAGEMDSTSKTVRDVEGHGSHTLSTDGEAMVPGVNVFGNGNGTAKGGSPKARIASYNVCWPAIKLVNATCFDVDVLAAFDDVIHDGVDVLSLSLGADPRDYFDDPVAIGSFHTVSKEITVVTHVSPWIITVGASTMDREFDTFVHLKSGLELKGTSLSKSLGTKDLNPLLTGEQEKLAKANAANVSLCVQGTLDPNKVK